jgi:hypothetical protein
MNDNDGGLAAMIIGQWVAVLLLALILWRISSRPNVVRTCMVRGKGCQSESE